MWIFQPNHNKTNLSYLLFQKKSLFRDTITVPIGKGDFYEGTLHRRTKNEILQRYWSGESVSSISADTGVAKSTLYKWIREAPPKKAKPVNMTDFRILKQRCETLEKMVEILQMSPCTVSAPLHDRYEVIKDLSDTYSITLLCNALKAEELYRNNYRSEREFRERIGAYIEFYNCKRPHQINRYRTPEAMEESYYKRHTSSGEEI